MPAHRRVRSRSRPRPPRISKKPLIHTSHSGAGSQSGTMRTKGSGVAKWPMPTRTIVAAKSQRAMRLASAFFELSMNRI